MQLAKTVFGHELHFFAMVSLDFSPIRKISPTGDRDYLSDKKTLFFRFLLLGLCPISVPDSIPIGKQIWFSSSVVVHAFLQTIGLWTTIYYKLLYNVYFSGMFRTECHDRHFWLSVNSNFLGRKFRVDVQGIHFILSISFK